jgi:hypothetical protein
MVNHPLDPWQDWNLVPFPIAKSFLHLVLPLSKGSWKGNQVGDTEGPFTSMLIMLMTQMDQLGQPMLPKSTGQGMML